MAISKDQKARVWARAKTIRGKDPDKYREDPYGNTLFWDSYGKNSEMGWEIDHITPSSRGGSDATQNLQALQTNINRKKGDSLKKKSRHSKTNK